MKLFITFTKKSLAVILAALIILMIIIGQALSAKATKIDGSTNALRVNFLESLGYVPNDSQQTVKDIIIPEDFGEVYGQYNKLQKKVGFDLSNFKAQKATLYTYPLDGVSLCAHIIVINGEIVGGDICSPALDGQMLPLLKQ